MNALSTVLKAFCWFNLFPFPNEKKERLIESRRDGGPSAAVHLQGQGEQTERCCAPAGTRRTDRALLCTCRDKANRPKVTTGTAT
jgi:hypothetical protein